MKKAVCIEKISVLTFWVNSNLNKVNSHHFFQFDMTSLSPKVQLYIHFIVTSWYRCDLLSTYLVVEALLKPSQWGCLMGNWNIEKSLATSFIPPLTEWRGQCKDWLVVRSKCAYLATLSIKVKAMFIASDLPHCSFKSQYLSNSYFITKFE
jgi:hypothetical protein